jgi:hypothetical protein
MCFETGSILNRFCHTFRKRGHIPIAVLIFKYLCPVFGHHFGYVDIKNLAGLVTHIVKLTGGQRAPIDLDRLNYVRIINFFQGDANAALLAAFISAGFWFLLFFSV